MQRFHLHPACQPFLCGRCGAAIDSNSAVITRDELEICEDCDDLADELSAARPDPRIDPGVAAFHRGFAPTAFEVRA
jgi:ribosome-binding protein aMBF1 (putative translation factor)